MNVCRLSAFSSVHRRLFLSCYPDSAAMKIAGVRAYLLSYPFAEPIHLPFYGGERTILKRDAMFIRVETDNGLVGYAPGPGSEIAQRAIEHIVAPFLMDRALSDPDALRVQFLEGPGAD